MSTCRSCQAPVIWLENVTTGKPAPIDRDPIPTGNVVVLDADHYQVIGGTERRDAIAEGFPLHTSHFATCPQQAAWRGRSRQRAQP